MAQMNLGQALWRLGEIIAMLKRFKITAALTKAGVEFIDEDNGGRPRLRRRSRRARRAAKYYTPRPVSARAGDDLVVSAPGGVI
jgi:hypothetical protein